MPLKEVALDLAAFLDSSEARALSVPPADVRKLAEDFLSIAYEELGKQPRLLDAEDVAALLHRHLPGRLAPRDPLAEHVPAVLRAYLDHLEGRAIVPQAYEIRRALEKSEEAFLARVESGENAGLRTARPSAPFVHRAEKTGRNDPCFCGSGKKFKKCHGKPG